MAQPGIEPVLTPDSGSSDVLLLILSLDSFRKHSLCLGTVGLVWMVSGAENLRMESDPYEMVLRPRAMLQTIVFPSSGARIC